MKPIPNISKVFRESRGFEPQRVRAKKLGISISLLAKIETGVMVPSAKVLVQQAHIDGKPLDFYFARDDHEI